MQERSNEELNKILSYILSQNRENELIEFKKESDAIDIGKYISALANSAAIKNQRSAFLVFGIDDKTYDIIGTKFDPYKIKCKQQEFFHYLGQNLSQNAEYSFHEFTHEGSDKRLILLIVYAAKGYPVEYQKERWIRVGSSTELLQKHIGKEKLLWKQLENSSFEQEIALDSKTGEEVFDLLDVANFFQMTGIYQPTDPEEQLDYLLRKNLIKFNNGLWDITNLGAILFANNLDKFPKLRRKSIRLTVYQGNNKNVIAHDYKGSKGYAIGFTGLIAVIKKISPPWVEEISSTGLRSHKYILPEIALREIIANALIHQDFSTINSGPVIEIFDNRIEVINPGSLKMDKLRIVDTQYSVNEKLSEFMNIINICEEKGSGIDRAINDTEEKSLPPIKIEETLNAVRVIIYKFIKFENMSIDDKIRACYWHCCIRYLTKEYMTNSTLRERFNLKASKISTVSRIIKQAQEQNLIRVFDSKVGTKSVMYVPYWA